jgi:hypothetical protein
MLISAEWILHILGGHPSAASTVRAHLKELPRSSAAPGPGDTVICTDAGDAPSLNGAAFVHGYTYRVLSREGAHVQIDGIPGMWDASRFRVPDRGVDPLSALLTAVDRGGWAEVLEARKAFE